MESKIIWSRESSIYVEIGSNQKYLLIFGYKWRHLWMTGRENKQWIYL